LTLGKELLHYSLRNDPEERSSREVTRPQKPPDVTPKAILMMEKKQTSETETPCFGKAHIRSVEECKEFNMWK